MPVAALILAGGVVYLMARAVNRLLGPDPVQEEPSSATLDEKAAETPPDPVLAPEISEAEREIDHHLAVSGGSLALAAAGGLAFPPHSVCSAIVLLYAAGPLFKRA